MSFHTSNQSHQPNGCPASTPLTVKQLDTPLFRDWSLGERVFKAQRFAERAGSSILCSTKRHQREIMERMCDRSPLNPPPRGLHQLQSNSCRARYAGPVLQAWLSSWERRWDFCKMGLLWDPPSGWISDSGENCPADDNQLWIFGGEHE